MDVKKEKEELIEMFGIHFESHHHLPPLASRILGTLIVESPSSGLTFENFVERLGASKSSISTSLNLLFKIGKITYYTLPGDRKKYFKASPLSERFVSYLKIIDFEKQIIDKMLSYREKTASNTAESSDIETIKEYKKHVIEIEGLIMRTIENFKNIEKK